MTCKNKYLLICISQLKKYILIRNFIFVFSATFFVLSPLVMAQDEVPSQDNYDPFSDYSEFTEASSEEADINFFRNGRLLSIGIGVGSKMFLGGYSEFYDPAPTYSLFINYFFDLQFAMHLGLSTSDHNFSFRDIDPSRTQYNSKMRLFNLSIYAKYFFNTQNMTRAFAEWNPYIIGGASQVSRSHASNPVVRTTDTAYSFDIGGGVEYLFNSKKNFFGVMLLYQNIQFADKGRHLPSPSSSGNGWLSYKRSGDPITIMATVGINY